jgi:hypothetical protein
VDVDTFRDVHYLPTSADIGIRCQR